MTHLLNVSDEDAVVSKPVTPWASETASCKQVNLNQLLQQLFAKEQLRIESRKMLIRCDQFPYVLVDESKITQICHSLLQMILEHPPEKGKLFMYIKCGVLKGDEVMNLALPQGERMFEISFNTNTQHLPGWDEPYKTFLQDCNIILQHYGGAFHYRVNSESSYLFQMILPGKLNEHATG
ncbi:MAG TPA: hypothetical protein VEY32_10220 [Flavisolibacter sp.]|jgi:hypothetical protein|nr:hypothetical protein [Flavisolibacter sp.]